MKSLENYLSIIQTEGDNYQIKKSPIHGHGVFTVEPIKKDSVIQLAARSKGVDAEITNFGKFVNHSWNPTIYLKRDDRGRYYAFAIRDLNSGEEMTADYSQYPEFSPPEASWK